ncbi:hypothetical protein ACVIU7_009319 [Bradyrhizobium liaoningense]
MICEVCENETSAGLRGLREPQSLPGQSDRRSLWLS